MTPSRILRACARECALVWHAFQTWHFWRAIVWTAVGVTLFGAAVNGIIIPHKFIAGGTTGFSLVLFYLTDGIPLSVIFWLVNIPIFIIGWRAMNTPYLVLSVIGAFMSGLGLQCTQGIHIPIEDRMLAAIVAGLMMGTAVGLYLRVGGSTGGLDIISTLVRKRFAIPMGRTFTTVNAVVLAAGAWVQDFEIALYTGISMFITAATVDRVQAGLSQRKSALIISSKPDAIAEGIMQELSRGVTFLKASGGRDGKETRVVYTVLNMREVGRLKELLYTVDPEAFVVINDAAEVIGKRFLTWAQEGYG